MAMTTNVEAVPRSGCNMISAVGKPSTSNETTNRA